MILDNKPCSIWEPQDDFSRRYLDGLSLEARVLAQEFEMRGTPGQGAILQGYAAVFSQPTDLTYFREQVDPKAFNKTIREMDVKALRNHNPDFIAGRSRGGPKNLRLEPDDHGLFHTLQIPDTATARAIYEDVGAGLIDAMSFAFATVKDEWDEQDTASPLRTLKQVRLFDVSYVVYPAYPTTSAEARGITLALRSLQDVDVPTAPDDTTAEPEPSEATTRSRERAAKELGLVLVDWGIAAP